MLLQIDLPKEPHDKLKIEKVLRKKPTLRETAEEIIGEYFLND